MNLIKSKPRYHFASILTILTVLTGAVPGFSQTDVPVVQIQADHVTAQMPPTFYGLMTEEINYSYEGGLYGEWSATARFAPIRPTPSSGAPSAAPR